MCLTHHLGVVVTPSLAFWPINIVMSVMMMTLYRACKTYPLPFYASCILYMTFSNCRGESMHACSYIFATYLQSILLRGTFVPPWGHTCRCTHACNRGEYIAVHLIVLYKLRVRSRAICTIAPWYMHAIPE